ncbi:capsular polysaccharide synthesis protein [Bifidobacterium pseudolongum subsp. globosum]|uniref:capsular polysaccharide synthesis protein n=1 Tax=Bifidobacterium pseudolongum TaxID=1694 RepID=UPI000CC7AA8D|nr:capsular polysaccharide synthesis protein [Bifidobacterium pseudolongum]PKU94635.1 capsular polysaccharide synthesis protein [Bifidobacterium pseudolongum subsp. globosum]
MNRHKELIQRFLNHAKVFSWGYASTELLTVLDRSISLQLHKPFSMRLMHHKERYIMTWARQFFHEEIEAYRTRKPVTSADSPHAPIWVCWLQGFNAAPELAQLLVKQIAAQSNSHPIRHITLNNYAQYVSLPQTLISKYKHGDMPQQQLADILRSALLAQHGGLWVDASMYLVQPIPEEVFTTPIFNVKDIRPNRTREAVACDFTKWQAYFIASHPGSVTYSFITDCFLKYWRHYDTLIDYFLFSYLAKIARDDLPGGQAEYESVPANNRECEWLCDYLMDGEPFDERVYDGILHGSTFAYKLSNKCTFPMRASDGSPTMAAKLFGDLGNTQTKGSTIS